MIVTPSTQTTRPADGAGHKRHEVIAIVIAAEIDRTVRLGHEPLQVGAGQIDPHRAAVAEGGIGAAVEVDAREDGFAKTVVPYVAVAVTGHEDSAIGLRRYDMRLRHMAGALTRAVDELDRCASVTVEGDLGQPVREQPDDGHVLVGIRVRWCGGTRRDQRPVGVLNGDARSRGIDSWELMMTTPLVPKDLSSEPSELKRTKAISRISRRSGVRRAGGDQPAVSLLDDRKDRIVAAAEIVDNDSSGAEAHRPSRPRCRRPARSSCPNPLSCPWCPPRRSSRRLAAGRHRNAFEARNVESGAAVAVEARIGRAVFVEPKHREVIGWRVVLAADHELPVGLLQDVRREIGVVGNVDENPPVVAKGRIEVPGRAGRKRSRQAGGEDDANLAPRPPCPLQGAKNCVPDHVQFSR